MLFECKNASLIYDQDKPVHTYAVRDINISIEQNKFIGILGPSGSGKSSLLYLLAGLKEAATGSVIYNGREYKNLDEDEKSRIRKKDFGFVFQRHFLIEYMSVLHNVLSVTNNISQASIDKAVYLLEGLGLKGLADKKPSQLSGGQSQRVALARALINDPKVVFGDELTASLDRGSTGEAMKFLKEYCRNSTLIIVTHDPTILEGADTILNIWDGKIKGGV
ncbi:MAG: ATP-binding cassette domain-containing protein [Bacillota bacterium]|nr:ATP-binding cassette domain-containing protein [Bacillota bacterium]